MDDERRARFAAWLKQKFGDKRGAYADAIRYAAGIRHSEAPLDRSFLSQVVNGKVAFGEEAAISMARRFGLPDGKFLADDSPQLSPEGIRLASVFDSLTAQRAAADPWFREAAIARATTAIQDMLQEAAQRTERQPTGKLSQRH